MKKEDIFDLLFPCCCVVCGCATHAGEKSICDVCFKTIKSISPHHCNCCGQPLPGRKNEAVNRCGNCITAPPSFDLARSLFCYETVIKDLLVNIKFNSDTPSLAGLKYLFEYENLSLFDDCQLIIPVPLYSKRLRKRGFNQALLLAKLLFANRLKDIFPFLLRRDRATKAQTGLSGAERRKNLKNVFSVSAPERIEGKKVCLVDDVYTTGTTVDECSRVLKTSGCSRVNVLTVARVVIDP